MPRIQAAQSQDLLAKLQTQSEEANQDCWGDGVASDGCKGAAVDGKTIFQNPECTVSYTSVQ